MNTHLRWLTLTLLTTLPGAYACQYKQDSVLPGYYASPDTKVMTSGPPMPAGQFTQGVTQAGGTSPAVATGSGASTTPAQGAAGASAMSGMSASAAGSSPTSSGEPTSAQGAAGTSGAPTATSGSQASEGPSAGMGAPVPAGECDLSGRWLVTSHLTTDALGALQYGHYYEYFEIVQQGDAFTVQKGFMCTSDAQGDGSLAASVDFGGARASLPGKVRYDGRTGTSTKTADGCQIQLENWYTVRGATIPYYLDPKNTLPTADQPAKDMMPGWEDWDDDGHPGITGVLSGVVSGKIYVAPRVWTAMSGTVNIDTTFRLAVDWGQQQNIMAYDGSALLGTEAAVAADKTLHFAQFARLADDQATGDDRAVCDAVLMLAPTLTPEAAGL